MTSPPICPNCGARQRRIDARFCQNCGFALFGKTHTTSAGNTEKSFRSTRKTSPWLWIIPIVFLGLATVVIFLFVWPGHNLLRTPFNEPEVIFTPAGNQTKEFMLTPSPTYENIPATESATLRPTKTIVPTKSSLPTQTTIPTPTKKSTPIHTPSPQPSSFSDEEKIRQLMQLYRMVKVESLTNWNTIRLDKVLSYPVIERQKRGICGLQKANQYYEYSNREFQIDEVTFTNETHAAVVAYIRENRILKKRNGEVIRNYGHEDYRAVFLVEKESSGQWKIYCFQALGDDDPVSCKVIIPQENPCRE